MHWGIKIVAVLAIFMIGIVGAGIYMVRQNSDTLEESDYYEKGIDYDVQYEQRENLIKHQAMPTLALTSDSLIIQFRQSSNQGVMILQRPSDRQLDTQALFQVEGNRFAYPIQDLTKGAWKLQLQWKHQNISFYFEQALFIPTT